MATPAPASTAEAMDMVLTGLSYLAATDPAALMPSPPCRPVVMPMVITTLSWMVTGARSRA